MEVGLLLGTFSLAIQDNDTLYTLQTFCLVFYSVFFTLAIFVT